MNGWRERKKRRILYNQKQITEYIVRYILFASGYSMRNHYYFGKDNNKQAKIKKRIPNPVFYSIDLMYAHILYIYRVNQFKRPTNSINSYPM